MGHRDKREGRREGGGEEGKEKKRGREGKRGVEGLLYMKD